MKSAGILFVTPDKTALFLQRGAGGDHIGEWCLPGGKQEPGETADQCALREAIEEVGPIPEGTRQLWTRQVSPDGEVDFTTFFQRVQEPFTPVLSPEHTGWSWAPLDTPPAPLHPGCNIALNRFTMDEMGIAKAIRDGQLTSPQRYENVSLFAIRITGTGVAYRLALKEFVWRDPNIYLNDDFCERCQGLPVIFEHPKAATLNSKEFADRIIGSVMFAYIVGNEVWGIAKVYDDEAIKMMTEDQLSTSPCVCFRDPTANSKMRLESGEHLLIEGKPSLLDHIAICKQGVWDKGGLPAGVSTTGDDSMTEEEKKAAEAKATADAEAKAKADAEQGSKLDKLLSGLDSISKRLDAQDAKMDAFTNRMDAFEENDDKPEPAAADKSKKDEGEEEASEAKEKSDKAKKDAEEASAKEEKEKADKARKDAESETARKIRALESRLPVQMTDAEYRSRTDAQAKADAVFQAFGDSAPRPLDGETLSAYRHRLATKLKEHSTRWGKVDLSAFADSAAFSIAEEQIYSDAMEAATNPKDLPEGQLRQVVRRDSTGREITTFYGEPQSWMRSFGANRRRLVGIRNRD